MLRDFGCDPASALQTEQWSPVNKYDCKRMKGTSRGNKENEEKEEEEEEEEDRALQTQETTIGLHLTKTHEGNVINPIDSHYSRRGRQRENRYTSAGCAETSG